MYDPDHWAHAESSLAAKLLLSDDAITAVIESLQKMVSQQFVSPSGEDPMPYLTVWRLDGTPHTMMAVVGPPDLSVFERMGREFRKEAPKDPVMLVTYASLGWRAKVRREEAGSRNLTPPVDRPDREEVAMILSLTMDGRSRCSSALTDREKEGDPLNGFGEWNTLRGAHGAPRLHAFWRGYLECAREQVQQRAAHEFGTDPDPTVN